MGRREAAGFRGYTVAEHGNGDPNPQNSVPLDWDSRGWARSWSVGPPVVPWSGTHSGWWPDSNNTCYHPFHLRYNYPPCSGWNSLVAYRSVVGPALDFRNVTVSITVRASTDLADANRIIHGTAWYTGLVNLNPTPLFFWAQHLDAQGNWYDFLVRTPIWPDYYWRTFTFTVTPEDWWCMGAGAIQKSYIKCMPPSQAMANVNSHWGWLLVGIDPQHIPVGTIEISSIHVQ